MRCGLGVTNGSIVAPAGAPLSIELLSFSGTATSAFGAFSIRESPTNSSSGETLLVPTNGGYLISGFLNVRWMLSFNGGISYRPANASAYLELSGPPGQTAPSLRITSPEAGSIQVCWPTQINRQYQLQSINALGPTNWTNLGAPVPGSGTNVCASDSIPAGVSRFYRVVIRP